MQTQLYEQWAPNQWSYGNAGPIPPFATGLLGAKLELWLMHYSMRTMRCSQRLANHRYLFLR